MELELTLDMNDHTIKPEDDETPKHKPTDDEIADMLMNDWKDDVRFFRDRWHEYNNGVWLRQRSHSREILDKLKELKRVGVRPSANKAVGISKFLEAYLWVDDGEIDRQSDYINLQNGIYNVKTNALEDFQRELYMTSQLPFAYDPQADCPQFKRFLHQTLRDENGEHDIKLRHLVEEALGYSLTNNTDQRVSFWLVGESGTGKSVLINTLHELAGNSHISIDLDEMSRNSYKIADIAGKRVVTFTEPRANSVLADNHYKRLVSQDEITTRQVYKESVRFTPICKVWGAMNHLPKVIDRSDAIFNRVIIIPMNERVPEHKRDYNLTQKLRGELAGIFNLAINGLMRLRKRGEFDMPTQSLNARNDYKIENDIELAFFNECLVRDEKGNIQAQNLYDEYVAWCKRNGTLPKSSIKVAREWKRLGLIKKKKSTIFYHGARQKQSNQISEN